MRLSVLELGGTQSSKTYKPQSILIIRVPLFLMFSFNEEAPKQKVKKGTARVPGILPTSQAEIGGHLKCEAAKRMLALANYEH